MDGPEGEECCNLALDDDEMERMDRELDEVCSDEVSQASTWQCNMTRLTCT